MAAPNLSHCIVVGAGAAGLMVARDLARGGKQVTVLEARDRLGGRIHALPVGEFGYAAEGGPEFVHGAAPVTRAVMREAGLALLPRGGTRWNARSGVLLPDDSAMPHADKFYRKAFGDTLIDYLLQMKRFELGRYEAAEAEQAPGQEVTDWEMREYFEFF